MRIQSAKSNKRRLYNWSKRLILGILGISFVLGVYFLLQQQLSQPDWPGSANTFRPNRADSL